MINTRMMVSRRQEAGLTQTDLAQKIGTVQQTISHLETGERGAPGILMLVRIARALKCSVYDLIEEETAMGLVWFDPDLDQPKDDGPVLCIVELVNGKKDYCIGRFHNDEDGGVWTQSRGTFARRLLAWTTLPRIPDSLKGGR